MPLMPIRGPRYLCYGKEMPLRAAGRLELDVIDDLSRTMGCVQRAPAALTRGCWLANNIARNICTASFSPQCRFLLMRCGGVERCRQVASTVVNRPSPRHLLLQVWFRHRLHVPFQTVRGPASSPHQTSGIATGRSDGPTVAAVSFRSCDERWRPSLSARHLPRQLPRARDDCRSVG